MQLTGKQVQQIQDALLDGYGSKDDLRMLVRLKLDQNLETIVDGGNLRVLIFNLVTWAERTDRVSDLVIGACDLNPDNAGLQRLANEWRTTMSTQPAVQPIANAALSPPASRVSIDVFLSYSRKDIDAMRAVRDCLREARLSVWTDEGLDPGTQNWKDAISEAVKQAHAMVVLLSPNSSQSTWVMNEVSFAQSHNKRIFPFLIAGDARTVVPIDLINVQRADGRGNLNQAVVQDLLPALRRLLSPSDMWKALPPAPSKQEVAGLSVNESQDSTHHPRKEPDIKRHRSRYLWVSVLILAGASGLFVIAQAILPLRLPAPTTTATSPTATWIPTSETSAAKVNPKDGAEYVFVPAAKFAMGSEKEDPKATDAERPQTTVNVDAFWIMRTEVTNSQYKRCVEQGGCTEPNNAHWLDPTFAEHPVTDVTWHQASEYAAWAGGRLPTEAEWEKACRGTEALIWPWPYSAPTVKRANFGDNVGNTTMVGQYSPQGDSPYGLADMAGNVWEWTSSAYRPYPYDSADGREIPEGDAPRTLRGGAFSNSAYSIRCSSRFMRQPDLSSNHYGFRVVSPFS